MPRKPKPEALKKLAGNPGKRPLRGGVASLPPGMPAPPVNLPEKVRAQWDHAGALLLPTGILTELDGLALLALCRAAADYLAYCELAPVGGDVLLSDDGGMYWNQAAAARDKAEARLLKMLAEFGLTPSSRARLGLAAPDEGPDAFETWLKNGAAVEN